MLYLEVSWFYTEVSFPQLQMSWIKSVFTTLLFTSGFLLLCLLWFGLASLIAQLVKIHLQRRRPRFDSCVGKICWRRNRLPTPVFLVFPGGSAGKESACNVGDLGLVPWRRAWLPTPIFLPGEFHGQRSLAGYSPPSHKESDTTWWLNNNKTSLAGKQ